MLPRAAFFFLTILLLAFPSYAETGKIEMIGAFTDATASEALKNLLEEKGYRITLADGTVACDIWFRKAVPTAAKKDVSGAIYTEIVESSVIGVISFPKTYQDFRGQDVQAGAYTMRYSLHPVDGNHLGISPYRDFILLSSLALDRNVEAQLTFEELTKMSAKAGGSNHAAAFSLLSSEGKNFPALTEDEHEFLIFSAKIKTSGGQELPIAFIIKGVIQH